jgi:hypothetical protein
MRAVPGQWMVLPLLGFAMTVAVFLPFARLGIDPHHDGVMLKPALDVYSGQRLFGDTFSMYGALSTYAQVFFLWAMGKTLLSIKVGTVLSYGLTASVLSLAWRRFLPLSLVVLSLVVCLILPNFFDYSPVHIMLPWSSVYAMVFQALGLLYLLKTIDGSSMGNSFIAGASAALVTWCRMPVGVFHTAACAAFLALMLYSSPDRKRYAKVSVVFLAGTLLVHGLFFAHLWATDSLTDWYLQNIRFPAIWAELESQAGDRSSLRWIILIVKRVLSNLFSLGSYSGSLGMRVSAWVITVLPLVAMIVLPRVRRLARQRHTPNDRNAAGWLVVPLIIFCGIGATFMDDWTLSLWVLAVPVVILTCTLMTTVLYVWKREPQTAVDARPPIALACAFLSLASWMQYYPIADPRHFFWALMPMIGTFTYFLFLTARGRILPVTVALLILAVPLCVTRTRQAVVVAQSRFWTIPDGSVLAGMAVPEADAQTWSDLLEAVRKQLEESPNVPLLSEGPDALWGCLVRNLRNATPFYINWDHIPWAQLGGRHTEAYPKLRDSFRESQGPLVYIRFDDSYNMRMYINNYNYKEFVSDSTLKLRLLSRSRPGSIP